MTTRSIPTSKFHYSIEPDFASLFRVVIFDNIISDVIERLENGTGFDKFKQAITLIICQQLVNRG